MIEPHLDRAIRKNLALFKKRGDPANLAAAYDFLNRSVPPGDLSYKPEWISQVMGLYAEITRLAIGELPEIVYKRMGTTQLEFEKIITSVGAPCRNKDVSSLDKLDFEYYPAHPLLRTIKVYQDLAKNLEKDCDSLERDKDKSEEEAQTKEEKKDEEIEKLHSRIRRLEETLDGFERVGL